MSRMYKRNGLNHSTSSRSSRDPSTQLEMSLKLPLGSHRSVPCLKYPLPFEVFCCGRLPICSALCVLVFQIESLIHRSIYFRLICLAHRLISLLLRLITGAYFPLNSTPLSESG